MDFSAHIRFLVRSSGEGLRNNIIEWVGVLFNIGVINSASPRSLVGLGVHNVYIYMYIYYIHPELRIWDCLFRSRKGAGPL